LRLALCGAWWCGHSINCQAFNPPLVLGYNEQMTASFLARVCLLAVLVFSQALLADHAIQHNNGNLADCQFCLQSSTGSAALPTGETNLFIATRPLSSHTYSHPALVPNSAFANANPSRAPPLYPL